MRGGCQEWQGGKCTQPPYTDRDADGSPHGWLLQTLEALNRTWPHPQNRLVNRGMMATGPELVAKCPMTYIPKEADAVIISFADMCSAVKTWGVAETLRETLNSTFVWSLEVIMRTLLRRRDPPTIVFFNLFKWQERLYGEGPSKFAQSCDAVIAELAQFYHVSTISMRNSLWHLVHPAHEKTEHIPFRFETWTIENGLHFDLRRGDRMVAELLYYWLQSAASADRPLNLQSVHQMQWLSEYPGQRRGRSSCYSFDDSFGGSVAEPQILGTSGWTKVDWVTAAGGEKKKKPGYVASRKGAELRIDTRQAGLQHVSIGYLQTYSSSAMVQIECEAPCSCTAEELRAHTSSRTSTTAMSPKLRAVAPAGTTCTLRLRMLTDQQPFKLIAIHVEDPTGAAEDV